MPYIPMVTALFVFNVNVVDFEKEKNAMNFTRCYGNDLLSFGMKEP